MIKDIAGVRICGANFDSTTDLMIMDPHDGKNIKTVRGSLLYGRNGAGKSTIAKAVKKLKGEDQQTISQACALDSDASPIVLTEEEKARVFVFDEDFVDRNIKLHESGLDTIIMLGQQAELAGQIEKANEELKKAQDEYNVQNAIVLDYGKPDNEKSPKYHMTRIRWALQGDDCWAGRDKDIKGNRTNTGVRDETYKQFTSLSTEKTRDQLLIEYSDKLKELRAAQQGAAAISSTVPTIDFDYDEDTLTELLITKIEKPELSEREKYLLNMVQSGKSDKLNEMISIFSDKSVCKCPTCFQPVDEEFKNDLVASIQKVLSKTVEEHQDSLRLFIKQEIQFDLTPFNKLEKNFALCNELLAQINDTIKSNNLIIQSKIDDPYTPCKDGITLISPLLKRFTFMLSSLEKERVEYNKKITATGPITRKLIEINNLIAHYDIKNPYLHYLECEAQLKIEKDKLLQKQEDCSVAKNHLDELEAKQKNVKVALSIINSNLSYIFFSPDRLSIAYNEGNYILQSNGNPVKPSQISQGERNIIGLCYFFASILQNKEEAKAYTEEYLILIDDPVSSFDIENKTGIMSFLRFQLGKFLLGNAGTRVVILTHDLLTYYDSDKILGELIGGKKNEQSGGKPIYKRFELRNKALIDFPYNGRQEYTELIKITYNFAIGNAAEYEIVIGNIMRQMMEAFSTFQYKKGIEDVSLDSDILAVLPEEAYRSYFENLMYRLVLNNGSHRKEQTKSMSDMNFFTVISASEKQRTAKEILCFIYLLNEKHLLSHLEDCADVKQNLTRWCTEIKSRVGA